MLSLNIFEEAIQSMNPEMFSLNIFEEAIQSIKRAEMPNLPKIRTNTSRTSH